MRRVIVEKKGVGWLLLLALLFLYVSHGLVGYDILVVFNFFVLIIANHILLDFNEAIKMAYYRSKLHAIIFWD